VRKLWLYFSRVPTGSRPSTYILSSNRVSNDAVCAWFELWSSVSCIRSFRGRDWKNECLPGSTGVAEKVPGLKQQKLLGSYRTGAVGADVTSVRCKGKWLPLGISVDADVLVSDDADAFKKVSDETGRSQQVCESHVGRNTDAPGENLSALIRAGKDRPLETIGVSAQQALADLDRLKTLIHTRKPGEQEELGKMYLRFANARKPAKGEPFSVAYRMRNLFLDRWNLWPRLTFYRSWKDEHGNEFVLCFHSFILTP